MTIGPAQRSPLDVSAPRLDCSPFVTSIAGVLQSRPVSRLTRVALAALLLTVPVLVTGAPPAMAQAVIGVENLNPLDPSRQGSLAAEPVDSPSAEATPAEGQPAADAVPAAEPTAAAGDATASASGDATTGAGGAAPTTYVVQAKDTMFSIARRHGVSVDAILWANGIAEPNVIKQGQKLVIPPSSGTLYTIKEGDTLSSVAAGNGVSTTGIATVNSLAEDASLVAGQQLLIPAPRQAGVPDPAFSPVSVSAAQVAPPVPVPSPAAPASTPVVAGTPAPLVSSAAPLVKPTDSSALARSPSPTGTPSVTVTTRKLPKFEWPIALKAPSFVITTPYRPVATGTTFDERKHDGIDVSGPKGHPVKAVAAGTVKRAEQGWNGGYGTLVVVDHGDGLFTWYAHLSEMSVSVGDRMQAGQKLGEVGNTGDSRGNHLHFEVRVNNTPINPMIALQS